MLVPLVVMFLLPVLLASFAVFDRLVHIEYTDHRLKWEADGKPHGFYWIPPESKMAGGWLLRFGSSSARNRCSFTWLFSTPGWMHADVRTLRLVKRLRLLVLTWNVGVLVAAIAGLFP